MQGLVEVLNEPSDDDEDSTEPSELVDSPPDVNAQGFNFVLCGPESFMTAPNALEHPPQGAVESLFRIYFQRVDPLFKVLHEPTMAGLMLKGEAYLGQRSDDPAVEALKFAIYYAAVTSYSDSSCKHTFSEDKSPLLTKYRFALEVYLAKADFLNSVKIEVIQALAIYLVSRYLLH